MPVATYDLLTSIAGRGAIACVTVDVVPAPATCVAFADTVPPWWREAATDGVEHALSAAHASASVQVLEILESNADTDAEQVGFAAAHATWRALGIEPPLVLRIRGIDVPPKRR